MILDKIDPATIAVVPDCRYGRMMVLSNDRYMGAAFVRYGEYSEAEVSFWRDLVAEIEQDAKRMVACDVGANIGAHTVAMAGLFGYVYAFEPLPLMYRMMVGNVALNGLANVLPIQAAVSDVVGTITIPAFDYTKDDNYGGIALGGYTTGIKAPQVRLDDVVRYAHFLKIDVEGMELQVLRGAERIVTECRPLLYFECNPEEGYDGVLGPRNAATLRWVQAHGYDCWFHLPPLYNPDNVRQAPAVDEHEAAVVSHNIIAIPSEREILLGGNNPIAKVA